MIMTSPFSTPILFLVFNRLETVKKVFSTIRKIQPQRLYIGADGPRADYAEESAQVETVRKYILEHIDWPCDVKTLFRERNLGCRKAVSEALAWFFNHEEEGIVLEDDCLPDMSFFPYAQTLLARYRHDTRIATISGDYFNGSSYRARHSYFFSRYPYCWGWASWRRTWDCYDAEMSQWPTLRETDWLLAIGDGDRDFQQYWTQLFDGLYFKGSPDTWDIVFVFSCWAQSAISILPSRNLVSNIGFGENATHTTKVESKNSRIALEQLPFPLDHPSTVVRSYQADRWAHENLYKKLSWDKRVLTKLKSLVH